MIFVEAIRHMHFMDDFLYTNYRLTWLKPCLAYEGEIEQLTSNVPGQ